VATFVLVHGSFSASWCWREIAPRLRTRGHRVVTVDLPAHGEDRTPIDQVRLTDYVESISRVVRTQEMPPILVGHSMGAPVAGVVESEPGSVAALVFVAGLLPRHGASMLDCVDGFDPEYLAQAIWAADRRSVRISPEGTRRFLYQRCTSEDADEAIRRMTPEPIAPYEAPVIMTDKGFGLTRRYYIETLQDRVIPLALQRSIQAQVGFRKVFSLDTDHAPFLSAPDELVSCLDSVAVDI
jgi:pimeloyl-ACP methyl ester carboxylesterase